MIHLPIERNYASMETPILTDYLGMVDAQIFSAEDALRALNITRQAMLGVLSERSPHADS